MSGGGCGRPCVQRQAPAVQRVRVEGAPDSVHRQSAYLTLMRFFDTAPLSEVAGWQSRVLRHVVGHLSVPALVVPVPQMVDQLPDIEQFLSCALT